MATNARHRQLPTLLHPGFVAAGAALLIAAFVTDVMYYETSLMQWANFSAWLIVCGLVMALIAAVLLMLDFLLKRANQIKWLHFIVLALVALLSFANALVHSRDAWTSVVPDGITLSAIVAILLLITGLRGWRVATVRDPVIVGARP